MITFLGGLVLLFVILFLLLIIDDKFLSGKGRPPGPFRLPIFGTVALIRAGLRKELPFVTFGSWKPKYGPIMSSKVGVLWQVILDDPKIIKEVIEGEEFKNRPSFAFILERSFGKSLGILFGNGEVYDELRKFSVRALRDFGFGKQMSQDGMMEEEMKELIEELNQIIENEDHIVNMEQFFTVPVLNIIWSMVAGIRFSHKDPKIQQLVRRISKFLRDISPGGDNILMAFPFLRHFLKFLPGSVQNRNETLSLLQADFQKILADRRKDCDYLQYQRDFIDVFLAKIDAGKHKSMVTQEVFTDQQFVTTLMDLFVAGSETTSNTSEFAVLFMILNPEVQEKVHEEIDRVVGRNRFPNANDRSSLPYVEATLYEVQRRANVTAIIPRAPHKDVTLRGYKIRSGTFTVLNMASYHHDPELWDNPFEFRPERFLDKNQKLINTEKLHVFGGGKRVCIAENLARATLFHFFATLMQSYTFEASPNHPKPTTANPQFGLSMSPQPYYARVIRRPF